MTELWENMECVPTLKGEIKKARASNYDLYSVLHEFIDNSLDAGADRVVIGIREYTEEGRIWIHKILVSDNAPLGIVDPRRIFSWTFERKRGSKETGEFGTGMKSASVNVADKLTVLTIRNGKDYVQAVADWHEMAAENIWAPKILTVNKEFLANYHPFPTGTTLLLENIRHDFLLQEKNVLEDLLEQMSWSYKYFLRENPNVSLTVQSSSTSYELSHSSSKMIYFFDHSLYTLESKVHLVKQHRSFKVFIQRDRPYWEQIEFVEKRKNGNNVLQAVEVAPWEKIYATLLFRSCTYYEEKKTTLPMSFGNVDVVRGHRVLVKNTSYRMSRSDPQVAFIRHEIFYENKSLNPMLGVQFNKINNGPIAEGSLKYALEYLQKSHEKELVRFEKTQLGRVVRQEKEEEDYLCLDHVVAPEPRQAIVVAKPIAIEQQKPKEAPFVLAPREITPVSPPKEEPPTMERRKHFSIETKLEVIKQQECRDCEFDFRLLDEILPIDYDHINGQPSNNSKENCQALSVVSHALKTRRPHLFEEYRKNPVQYIIKLLNCITSSKYFLDAYLKKQILINTETDLVHRNGLFYHRS